MAFIKTIKSIARRNKNNSNTTSNSISTSQEDSSYGEKRGNNGSRSAISGWLKKKSDCDFMMRWNHIGPPPLGSFKAGSTVKALEFRKDLVVTLKSGQVKMENMVKVVQGKGKKAVEGFVSAVFLEFIGDQGKISPVAQKVKAYPVNTAQLEGRWFFGRCSPIDCALWLANRSYLNIGSYLVCQPSFLYPNPGEWPRFMLVVRTASGSIEWINRSWFIDDFHNAMAMKKLDNFTARSVVNDVLPPNDPPSYIAYLIIKRTKEGRYFIENPEQSFYLLPELLEHHLTAPLTFNGAAKFTLQEYIQSAVVIDEGRPIRTRDPEYSFRCPAPPAVPAPPDAFSGADHPSLIRSPNTRLDKIPVRLFKNGLQGAMEQSSPIGSARKAVFLLQRGWTTVSFRIIDKEYLSLEGLSDDLLLLENKARKKTGSSEAKGLKLNPIGTEYLAHIVTGDITDKKFGAWLAYEYVEGIPLNDLLERRKFDGEPIAMRPRYEVMAQIAAGMRFLEQNGLCHRHLNCKNVIVLLESLTHLRVKITDYMLPYSFLNKVNAKSVNINNFVAKSNAFLWWAPEAIISRTFDIKADVWSYGCLIFEILTDGEVPYSFEASPITKITELIHFFENPANKMKLAPEVSKAPEPFIHQIVYKCLNRDPNLRPKFATLDKFFCDLLFNTKLNPTQVIREATELLGSAAPKPTSH